MSAKEVLFKRQVKALQGAMGYQFSSVELVVEALTHRSFTNEATLASRDNERLEFLGDSVLGMVVSEYLYRSHPSMREGELSRARSQIVREASLAEVGAELGLGEMILLGRGEEATGGRGKASVLANAVEALLGAIFVDGGIDAARTAVMRLLGSRLAASCEELTQLDPKGRLQEMAQSMGLPPPTYVLLEQAGPEHDRRFQVEVQLLGHPLAVSTGRSKKDAAASAAVLAIELINSGNVVWPEAHCEEVEPS